MNLPDDPRWYQRRVGRLSCSGACLGLGIALFVGIAMVAWRIHWLAGLLTSLLEGGCLLTFWRKIPLDVLGDENPWLKSTISNDRAAKWIRFIFGLMVGIVLGLRLALVLCPRSTTGFVASWTLFALATGVASLILGDRFWSR